MATRRKRSRIVPRLLNAVPDAVAAKQLSISRMTLFRKLRDGIITEPLAVVGTKRRWWRAGDIQLAKEQLEASRQEVSRA